MEAGNKLSRFDDAKKEVATGAKHAVDQARDLYNEERNRLGSSLATIGEAVGDISAKARRRSESLYRTSTDFITERPLQSAFGALAIGYVVGAIIHGWRSRD